jgi:hypothetical protein
LPCPSATDEAESAVRWYSERVRGLDDDFRVELLGAVDRADPVILWPPSAYDRMT